MGILLKAGFAERTSDEAKLRLPSSPTITSCFKIFNSLVLGSTKHEAVLEMFLGWLDAGWGELSAPRADPGRDPSWDQL